MQINIISKNEMKELVKEEVEKKFRKELDIIWKHLNRLKEEIKLR